jgi:EAL domain-containing protein (putative c-di-GMP-specific phosphodiesterase class I)
MTFHEKLKHDPQRELKIASMATAAAAIDPLKPPFSAMRTERDRFAALAFCWADILLELNGESAVVYAAGATGALIGRDAHDLVGKRLHEIVVPEDRARLEGLLSVARGHGRIENQTVRLLGKKGPTPPLAMAGYRLDDLNGHYFLALRTTSTARVGDEPASLVRDRETGLYDSDSFVEMVTRHLASVDGNGQRQMTLIALPGYEELSERLGEGPERELLANVGACLGAGSADGDAAGRIDADRYGLVHRPDLDIAALQGQIAELTRKADPIAEGTAVESATIDIDGDLASEEEIASGLLYAINRFRGFKGSDFSLNSLSTSLSNLAKEAIEGVAEFKHLIAHADFEIAFQPIIGVRTGRIHHYEALARFPERYGKRTPYEHIVFAEETGLIADFDLAVARKAIDRLRTKTPVNSKTCVAVNISGQSVGLLSFLARLDALLKEHPWSPGRLMFEITESARMQDLSAANTFIQRLRNQGYPVCLDDFGAGAANFEYLTTLDVDIVKFDGPALRNARKAQKGKAFLKAFVALCRDLGIATVAEMIDDEAGLKFIRECGVQYVQGYLFGRPSTDIHAFKNKVPAHLFAAPTAK